MQVVKIWCDGAADPNPGKGGWAALIKIEHLPPVEISGGVPFATNNQMEMRAAIEALNSLTLRSFVTVYTDSQYLQKGMTTWVHKWKCNGWHSKHCGPVKNKDMWMELLAACYRHQVIWKWVRGHAGHAENERCDELAVMAMRGQSNKPIEPSFEI